MPAVVGVLIATVNGGGKRRAHAARRRRVAGTKRISTCLLSATAMRRNMKRVDNCEA